MSLGEGLLRAVALAFTGPGDYSLDAMMDLTTKGRTACPGDACVNTGDGTGWRQVSMRGSRMSQITATTTNKPQASPELTNHAIAHNGASADYRRASSTASRASALGLDTLTCARSRRTIQSWTSARPSSVENWMEALNAVGAG